jgi:Alkylmercury lyase
MTEKDAAPISVRPRRGSRLHRFILETFAATGRAPSLEEIRARFQLGTFEEAESRVAQLESAGTIHRTPGDASITHAYPFSNEPTAHVVQLDGGPRVFAMCAIDALGMPFMLKRDALIESSCMDCGSPVLVDVAKGTVARHEPPELMVWLADQPEGCVVATDICPNLNFFCSAEHLGRWQHGSGSAGRRLTLAEAVAYGRQVFESLMDDDAASRDATLNA